MFGCLVAGAVNRNWCQVFMRMNEKWYKVLFYIIISDQGDANWPGTANATLNRKCSNGWPSRPIQLTLKPNGAISINGAYPPALGVWLGQPLPAFTITPVSAGFALGMPVWVTATKGFST
jgi:hypothetical protein